MHEFTHAVDGMRGHRPPWAMMLAEHPHLITEGTDMADLPRPSAARLRQPSWRDTRLVVGVVIVLLSMAIGAKVVAAADDTVPMYAAVASLVPGQPVTQRDVRRIEVQLGADRSRYVVADHDIAPDTFALRDVRPGELPVSYTHLRA